LAAAGLHTGAVAWMLRSEPMAFADQSPPAAIMVELAEVPVAVRTEKNEITPDQTSTRESAAQEEQRSDETAEKKPLEKAPEPAATEREEETRPTVEKAEIPLPAAEPEKDLPKQRHPKKEHPKHASPEKKPKPRRQKASPQSKATIEAQAQVRRSERTAAAQTASGVGSVSSANWQSQLMAHLERRKRYPPGAQARGERGIVYVRFTIDESGNVLSANLVRSSGHAELDQEVLSLVRKASPVPAPPPGVQRDIIAPVRFSTN
jgi:protein TonB